MTSFMTYGALYQSVLSLHVGLPGTEHWPLGMQVRHLLVSVVLCSQVKVLSINKTDGSLLAQLSIAVPAQLTNKII